MLLKHLVLGGIQTKGFGMYVRAGLDVPKVKDKYVASMTCDSEAFLTTTFQEKDEVKSLVPAGINRKRSGMYLAGRPSAHFSSGVQR